MCTCLVVESYTGSSLWWAISKLCLFINMPYFFQKYDVWYCCKWLTLILFTIVKLTPVNIITGAADCYVNYVTRKPWKLFFDCLNPTLHSKSILKQLYILCNQDKGTMPNILIHLSVLSWTSGSKFHWLPTDNADIVPNVLFHNGVKFYQIYLHENTLVWI